MAARVGEANPYAAALDRIAVDARLAGRDPLNQALYLWCKIHLPNFILTFLSDRMEMSHSIEGRVPFLDHKVAEYAAGVPIHLKIKGMREKHVLREATRDVLIEAVYNREKHPFTTPPTGGAVNDAMLAMYADVLASKALDEQPIFDPAAVRSLFAQFAKVEPDQRVRTDALLHRVVSLTLMQERFGMTA